MRVGTGGLLIAVAVLLGSVPATAQEATDAQDVRRQLEQNDAELADAQDRLEAAEDLLDAAAAREEQATAELGVLQAQLLAAREREALAVAAAREQAGLLADDDRDVVAGRIARDGSQAALEDRVVWIWMHGAAADASMRMRMAAGARTLHDLVMGRRVVDELVAGTRTARDAAARVLGAAVAGRADEVDGRDLARRDAFDASVEAGTIEVLERQLEAVLVSLAHARSDQEMIYTAIQSDRDALAALSLQLRRTLARVSLTGALVPPADLPLDGPPPPWIELLPAAGHQWATAVEVIAVRHGVDGALFTALVWSESGFHPHVVSHAGAIGLAQLMPGTARGLGVDPYDPYENLAGGARYLRAQIEAFQSAELGLAAYNAGPGRVRGAGNRVPDIAETQHYVIRVLERWERLRAAA